MSAGDARVPLSLPEGPAPGLCLECRGSGSPLPGVKVAKREAAGVPFTEGLRVIDVRTGD